MKFTVIFPASAGQYAGTHTFATLKERVAFMKRAAARGVDITTAKLGKQQ